MANKLSQILVPLRAPTPETLSKKMFENNVKNSRWFGYTDPTFANGQWVTWFTQDIELELNDTMATITPINHGASDGE